MSFICKFLYLVIYVDTVQVKFFDPRGHSVRCVGRISARRSWRVGGAKQGDNQLDTRVIVLRLDS